MVDTSPSPVARAPKLAGTGGARIPLTWVGGGRERGKIEVREQSAEVQPGPHTVGRPCRKVRPGAQFQTAQRAEKWEIVKAGEPWRQGEEERVGRGTEDGGKAEGGVRAQRAKTASPDWRGGVGADEIALAWLEELIAGDLRSLREAQCSVFALKTIHKGARILPRTQDWLDTPGQNV